MVDQAPCASAGGHMLQRTVEMGGQFLTKLAMACLGVRVGGADFFHRRGQRRLEGAQWAFARYRSTQDHPETVFLHELYV